MSAPAHYHGKTSLFSVNATTIHSKGWTVDDTGEELRSDNTFDAGFSNRITGTNDLKVTIETDWDASANPLDGPPALAVGTVLTTVKLYLQGTSSPFWLLPSAIVLSSPMESKVGGIGKITFNIANKGTYTRPTGTFTPTA
jgi:hypothetical protein